MNQGVVPFLFPSLFQHAIPVAFRNQNPVLHVWFARDKGRMAPAVVFLVGNSLVLRGFFEELIWATKKNTGCLGYIGDYTTQLYWDCNKPL